MTNQITNTTLASTLTVEEIGGADTETLKYHLKSALGLTVQLLAYLAAIWRELEERGEDLSSFRKGFLDYLPLISQGRLAPELVVNYTNKRVFLLAVSHLPMRTQLELVQDGVIPCVTIEEDGTLNTDPIPIEQLHASHVRFVIADDRLRPEDEQVKLRRRAREIQLKVKQRRVRKVEADIENEAIVVGNFSIPAEKAVEVLSEIYGFDVAALIKNAQNTRKAFSGKVSRI